MSKTVERRQKPRGTITYDRRQKTRRTASKLPGMNPRKHGRRGNLSVEVGKLADAHVETALAYFAPHLRNSSLRAALKKLFIAGYTAARMQPVKI